LGRAITLLWTCWLYSRIDAYGTILAVPDLLASA
jgi:hypothetical protein